MTSLEMRGVQLSVLRVDEDWRSWWLTLLDAPTSAPLWPHPLYHDRITPERLSDEDYLGGNEFGVIMITLPCFFKGFKSFFRRNEVPRLVNEDNVC